MKNNRHSSTTYRGRRLLPCYVKDTKGYKYTYVSGSQVLHKLNPELNKHGINITFRTSQPTYEMFKNNKGNLEFLVSLNVHYTITNTDNPEEQIESEIYAIGHQDDASKALGTALTYSERYFLMKFFGLPTDEDDADAKQKKAKYNTEPANDLQLTEINQKLSTVSEHYGMAEEKLLKSFGVTDRANMTEAQADKVISRLNQGLKKMEETKQ
ncbi:ERF family protein [Staphylococcus massiliensis]|uniref:ERF family protein n=1 Tax=Staphylococcus massiliensis TaxID=555791 RepID=UPI0030D04F6C|nr:ERF family protein [Staphylococcus massiliensis]